MTQPPSPPPPASQEPPAASDLPRPVIKKMHWPYPLIWVVPLIAAAIGGYYYWIHLRSAGPAIIIHFKDASGLRANQSEITHRGVSIGKIGQIELSRDQHEVLVHVQLLQSESAFAHNGSTFWIVRPEISGLNISGLGTVVSGPYIDAIPGDGGATSEFTGFDKPPKTAGGGLIVILHADRLDHLSANASVTYRGIQVGEIQATQLSLDATHVDIYLLVWPQYKDLVHSDSQFWTVSGFDVKGGLFTGIQAKLGSIGDIITGAVAFATPDQSNAGPVDTGAEFILNAESKKEWDKWAPKIAVLPGDSSESAASKDLRHEERAAKSAVQAK